MTFVNLQPVAYLLKICTLPWIFSLDLFSCWQLEPFFLCLRQTWSSPSLSATQPSQLISDPFSQPNINETIKNNLDFNFELHLVSSGVLVNSLSKLNFFPLPNENPEFRPLKMDLWGYTVLPFNIKILMVNPNIVWVKVSIDGVLSSLLLLVENICIGIKTIKNTAYV